ncbi:MAG: hypothetical protein ACK4E1_07350, partial [Fervidobacterium nodosum]
MNRISIYYWKNPSSSTIDSYGISYTSSMLATLSASLLSTFNSSFLTPGSSNSKTTLSSVSYAS